MLGETITNLSLLLGIDPTIIPNIITFIIVVFLIILTFRTEIGGLASVGVIIALYTVSMGILTILGIDSIFNIFSLLGDTLGDTV